MCDTVFVCVADKLRKGSIYILTSLFLCQLLRHVTIVLLLLVLMSLCGIIGVNMLRLRHLNSSRLTRRILEVVNLSGSFGSATL